MILLFLARKIYEELVNLLNSCQIPLDNVIGFSADGCNSMMGAHNSVASRLKENFPGKVLSCVPVMYNKNFIYFCFRHNNNEVYMPFITLVC